MKSLVILLLFCHTASAETHTLKVYITGSIGLTYFPAFEVVEEVDEIQALYCSAQIIEMKQDWMEKVFNENPLEFDFVKHYCYFLSPPLFGDTINFLMKGFNQSEGIHVLQTVLGCELNLETGELTSFLKDGYDGEDLLEFDLKGQKWIALREEALLLKQLWEKDTQNLHFIADLITHQCYQWLTGSLLVGNSTLTRTDHPSVSLLQTTPSSPVRCHATGFYPQTFLMFWMKDGEEIHEGVSHGKVLNNQDNTFQYRVDLNISSIPSKDWKRYDCVFHFAGAEDRITIKLDKAVIKTNWVEESSPIWIIIVAVISVLIALIIIVLGITACRKRNERPLTPDSENMSL